MADHTPVERFAIEAGELSTTPRVPSLNFEGSLQRFVLDWCLTQGIAESAPASWEKAVRNDSSLSMRGRRLCLELEIDAATIGEIQRQLYRRQTLLPRIIDWLIRKAYIRRRQAAYVSPPLGQLLQAEKRAYQARAVRSVQREIDSLEGLLTSGNSAWTVDPTVRGLVRRLGAEEQSTFEAATAVDDPATAYLREAWEAAWGTNPNGETAHDKAIKALEAAFRPVVTPKSPGAKLNTIADHLRDGAKKWNARMESVVPWTQKDEERYGGVRLVETAVRTVFAANYRHAGVDGHAANDLDDGRDAVTLAAALIALQRRGFLALK